ELGPDARAAAADLTRALENASLRDSATSALVRMGKAAVPDMLEQLQQLVGSRGTDDSRIRIISVLGRMGPGAGEAVPCLFALEQNRVEMKRLRDAARSNLKQIRP